jgi:hypothetical protein
MLMMRRIGSVLPILLCLGACSSPLCSSKTVTSLRSPTGEHRAVMFMRECGATTDFTTQVSIDPQIWQWVGNVFVADAYDGGRREDWGGPWADIRWTGPNELLVTYDRHARVFDRNAAVGDVKVTYRSVAR